MIANIQSVSVQRVSHNVKFTLYHLHAFYHLHLPDISPSLLLFCSSFTNCCPLFFFQTEADPEQVSPNPPQSPSLFLTLEMGQRGIGNRGVCLYNTHTQTLLVHLVLHL